MIHLDTALRPRGLPEIFDTALESFRRDPGPIAAASLLLNAPLAACLLALLFGLARWGDAAVVLLLPVAALAAALVLARPIGHGAIASICAERIERGKDPGLRTALAAALGNGLAVGFAGVAVWAAAAFGFVLFFVPAIIFPAFFALAVPSAAVEGRGPFDSLRRSVKLLKGTVGRAIGLNLFSAATYAIVGANLYFAVQGSLIGARVVFGVRTAYYEATLTLANPLFLAVLAIAVHLVVDPWRACALYHLHLDSRVRHEAVDLVHAVDRLEAAAPAAGVRAA